MSHIRKTPAGTYEARYRDPDGHERCQRFRTKNEAQQHLDRIGVTIQRGQWHDPAAGRVLVSTWIEEYERTTVNLRPSSKARDEAYTRNHITPRFGDRAIGKITQREIRSWVTDLTEQGLAPASVQKAYQILSKIMRGAVDAGLIPRSPCERVPLPKVERHEMRFLEPGQIDTLADTIDERYRTLVVFDSYCGLRLGELAGLRWSRVDTTKRTVRVEETAVEVRGELLLNAPKTSAGWRAVPMPGFVANHLDALREQRHAQLDDLVFPAPEGGPLRAGLWRNRFWYPAVKAAGFDGLRPHDMRHTAVSLWIAAGASPKQIATWAGHTSVSVVLDRYGHLIPGNEDPVMAKLERLANLITSSPRTARR